MASTRRTSFRTASSLHAAALLVLTGCVAAACSTSAIDDESPSTAQPLTGGSPCEGVELDASRQYRPRTWTDGEVSFPVGSLTFNVPSEIPVTQGSSDHGKAKFTFSLGGANPTTCVYRGNGGTKYTFVKCRQAPSCRDEDDDDNEHPDGPADPLPTAGSSVTADTFRLHVNRGNRRAGTTAVRLHLGGPVVSDGNLCTTDACNSSGVVTHTPVDIEDNNPCTIDSCDPATGTKHDPVDSPVCRGELAFDRSSADFGGNGRACTTCHIEADNFTLKPATVEARLAALPLDSLGNPVFSADPLFSSLDADDFATNFTRLRQGLARVNITLPANVTVDEFPGASSVPLFRAVPSIQDIVLTDKFILVDGRAATLQIQALGASQDHMRITTIPAAPFFDDIAAYQRAQFSSPLVAAAAARVAAGEVDVPRAEPALNADETAGRDAFNVRCATCHGGTSLTNGPLTTVPGGGGTTGAFRNVSVSLLNRAALPALNFRVKNPTTGVITLVKSPDPGRLLTTGILADANRFDVPTVYGISHTAPYFHDNHAKNLQDVMKLYQDDFLRQRNQGNVDPAVAVMSDEEMRVIIAYMQKL